MNRIGILVLFAATYLTGCGEDSNERKIISTELAPAAIGPYSQAVLDGNHLYIAGQIPLDPESGEIVKGGIAPQTHRVLNNIENILAAANMDFKDVVQVQIFLTDLNNYQAVNQIYASYFDSAPPARAVVEVSRLPKDVLIEVLTTAVKRKKN